MFWGKKKELLKEFARICQNEFNGFVFRGSICIVTGEREKNDLVKFMGENEDKIYRFFHALSKYDEKDIRSVEPRFEVEFNTVRFRGKIKIDDEVVDEYMRRAFERVYLTMVSPDKVILDVDLIHHPKHHSKIDFEKSMIDALETTTCKINGREVKVKMWFEDLDWGEYPFSYTVAVVPRGDASMEISLNELKNIGETFRKIDECIAEKLRDFTNRNIKEKS